MAYCVIPHLLRLDSRKTTLLLNWQEMDRENKREVFSDFREWRCCWCFGCWSFSFLLLYWLHVQRLTTENVWKRLNSLSVLLPPPQHQHWGFFRHLSSFKNMQMKPNMKVLNSFKLAVSIVGGELNLRPSIPSYQHCGGSSSLGEKGEDQECHC